MRRGRQPRPVPGRPQDGDRDGQDGRDGDAHRLAHPQQVGEPAGSPVQRRVPHRGPGHHDPRPPPGAPAVRSGELLPASATSCRPTAWPTCGRARIVITNFHAFQLREKVKAPKLTKEHRRAAARRVHRDARRDGAPRDPRAGHEAQHRRDQRRGAPLLPASRRCRRQRVSGPQRGGQARSGEARRGGTGLAHAASRQSQRRSACAWSTTCRPRPSTSGAPGWPEGTLFQWVVSDFSLIDAIEAGLVKIPRVPVDDNAQQSGDLPTYRGPVAAHPRRPAEEGPQDRRRRRAGAERCRRRSKARCRACTATTRRHSAGGRSRAAASTARRRRCSSSSATTRTSRSWSSTTSPAGRSRCPDGTTRGRARQARVVLATPMAAGGRRVRRRSSSTRRSSTRARR